MIYQTVDLKELYPEPMKDAPETPLIGYSADDSPELAVRQRPAIVIHPGGGYEFLSDREAEVVALEFLARGYHAFILRYALKPYAYPVQLSQSAAAVRYLRQHAAELKVDPERIAVLGFSAGGHAAGAISVLSCEQALLERFGAKRGELTPNASVLCYAVTTNKFYRHQSSMVNVSGGNAELADYLSLEERIDENTPPAFLWHTAEDACVDVRNALCYASACREHGIPFELHVYEKGCHGLSLCDERTRAPGWEPCEIRAEAWLSACLSWLKERGIGL